MEKKLRELDLKIKDLKEKVSKVAPFQDELFNDPRFSNQKINVGKTTFYVCKHQLAKKSPVFKSMFSSGLKEAEEGVLELHDDPAAVEAMLKYVYMNSKINDLQLAMNVVPLAYRYDLTDLMNECELAILNGISDESAEQAFDLAGKFDLKLVFAKSCQHLLLNADLGSDTNCP
uniref:BTB domain-containing protein n=4 Tax=Bursaphelenchus xylophilus TaxID=6326 RepID=A0A1I7SGE0_BURXY